jgi:hypothetical protein
MDVENRLESFLLIGEIRSLEHQSRVENEGNLGRGGVRPLSAQTGFGLQFRDCSATYFTVAETALCNVWPAVLVASTAKRWLPAARLMVVLSCLLELAVYFFTPSTHNSIRAMVPVTVAEACTSTGELTVEPLVGAQMCTPFEAGALHTGAVGTTTKAFEVDAMVYGEPGTAVMLLDVTVYA